MVATAYTSAAIVNYNPEPPADDGSQVASNQLNWSKHKDKLADPIKTLAELVNTNVVSAFGTIHPLFSETSVKSANYTLAAADDGVLFLANANGGAFTFTLLAAATAGDGYRVGIKKTDSSSNAVTLDGSGAETIDGAATDTITTQYDVMVIVCDGSNWHISTDTPTGQATQAAVEAETNEDTYVPPDLVKNSPGVAKAWARIASNGVTTDASYNVAAHTDNAAGRGTLVIDTDFSSTSYVAVGTGINISGAIVSNFKLRTIIDAGSFDYFIIEDETAGDTMAATDEIRFMACFGDQ